MAEITLDQSRPLSRREFLSYIWTASLALSLAGSGGAMLWYAYPRFRAGEFGGEFPFSPAALPEVGADPEGYPGGRFWLVNTENGLLALYMVCTHLAYISGFRTTTASSARATHHITLKRVQRLAVLRHAIWTAS